MSAERKPGRRSRWSANKAFVPGMPTILPSDMDDTQRQAYLLQIEIEETTRKLRMNEFTTPSEDRSPSPEPVYDNMGKRLNTREVRKRQELEQKRHEKIQTLLKLMPEYKPPADYRPPNTKLHQKIYIPQDAHPEINFVGLLIGPRGNTLKALETETGARIIIRGRGSVKEGKLLRRDGPMPGENEPLHAFISSTDPDVIKVAVEKITSILDDALNKPDANNTLRQNQLRELAVLNGTFRPEDILGGVRCSNCGSDQHKTYECTEAANVTANIICAACGCAGHISKDCLAPKTGYQAANNEELDNEYQALLAEIGDRSKSATTSKAATGAQLPFRLPLQQGHPFQPLLSPQPLSKVPHLPSNFDGYDLSAGFYPPPPPLPLDLPPLTELPNPETLDPVAVAAARAAMAAAGIDFNPYLIIVPPPPPPVQSGANLEPVAKRSYGSKLMERRTHRLLVYAQTMYYIKSLHPYKNEFRWRVFNLSIPMSKMLLFNSFVDLIFIVLAIPHSIDAYFHGEFFYEKFFIVLSMFEILTTLWVYAALMTQDYWFLFSSRFYTDHMILYNLFDGLNVAYPFFEYLVPRNMYYYRLFFLKTS